MTFFFNVLTGRTYPLPLLLLLPLLPLLLLLLLLQFSLAYPYIVSYSTKYDTASETHFLNKPIAGRQAVCR